MLAPKWHYFFGTGLGFGYSPMAPGTFGTLSGLIIALTAVWGLGVAGLLVFIGVSSWGNYYFYEECEKKFGADPGAFVLDEWVGIGITLLPIVVWNVDIYIGTGLSFGLFRFFDVSKILGIDYLQSYPKAHGVLFDDILAGIYSAICLILLIFTVL